MDIEWTVSLKSFIKDANKTYFMLQKKFLEIKIYLKTKVKTKEHNNKQNVNICTRNWILSKRDRKQINVFERKVYRRILSPVYDNEKENWRILTNKETYALV
jgi:hypothetical protein